MKILTVDDEKSIRTVLRHMLTACGYEVEEAENGQMALEILQNSDIQLVISDWEMPKMTGPELCKQIRESGFHRYIYFILLTSRSQQKDIVTGLESGADDFITKPFNPDELRVRVRAGERIIGLETRDLAIFAMAQMVESRDHETGEHLERVRTYARMLSEHLQKNKTFGDQINGTFCNLIYLTSPLHDIGKISMPDAILQKKGKLTEAEFEEMKTHTLRGSDTLQAALDQHPGTEFLRMARDIARSHHERFDGNGYPDGLVGEDIPLSARILTLADVYDALTSERVYKEAYSHEKAKGIICQNSGTQFDSRIVDAFLAIEDQFDQIRTQHHGDTPTSNEPE